MSGTVMKIYGRQEEKMKTKRIVFLFFSNNEEWKQGCNFGVFIFNRYNERPYPDEFDERWVYSEDDSMLDIFLPAGSLNGKMFKFMHSSPTSIHLCTAGKI